MKLVAKIKIDYDRCIGCKKCVEVCTYGVLEWFENSPIVVNPSSCIACLECENNCLTNAIRVKKN